MQVSRVRGVSSSCEWDPPETFHQAKSVSPSRGSNQGASHSQAEFAIKPDNLWVCWDGFFFIRFLSSQTSFSLWFSFIVSVYNLSRTLTSNFIITHFILCLLSHIPTLLSPFFQSSHSEPHYRSPSSLLDHSICIITCIIPSCSFLPVSSSFVKWFWAWTWLKQPLRPGGLEAVSYRQTHRTISPWIMVISSVRWTRAFRVGLGFPT